MIHPPERADFSIPVQKRKPPGRVAFWSGTGADCRCQKAAYGIAAVLPAANNSPPGCCIQIGSTLSVSCSKKESHPGGWPFWSRIRESNPPSRLGKPLYYRYTNPATVGYYSRAKRKIQPFFVGPAKYISGRKLLHLGFLHDRVYVSNKQEVFP